MSRTLHRRTRQIGFTLIELMVALGLSMLLAVALLTMQTSLGKQTVRNADTGLRDAQSRAALDLITQDLSGAGFLLGNTQNVCNALITYNGSSYFIHHPVDAIAAAASSVSLGFTKSTGGLALNYPPSSSTVPSDVLVMTGSLDSTNFNSQTRKAIKVLSSTTSATSTGNLSLSSTTGMSTTDYGILQVPMNGLLACFRLPISTITAGVVGSSGSTMPSAFYGSGGYGGQTATAGFTGTLTDAEIFNSKMADIGPPTTPPNEQTVAYYVDNNGGSYPLLMRATYSLFDDSLITSQQVAAGVVSLQVRFGVDTTGTGVVTPPYKTAAQVTSANQWGAVRSTRVAVVLRSLTDDPDTTYSVPSTTLVLGNGFSNVPIPTASIHRHYVVQQTEIAARNLIW